MKLITWNVNGFRAIVKKGFKEFISQTNPDIVCLQETKIQDDQVETSFEGYLSYFHCAVKKGYAGTAVFTKIRPLNVTYDIGDDRYNGEGRVITLEFDDFFLVNSYSPNSKRELSRLAFRMEWQDAFRGYLDALDEKKPVIMCGDLNVAHQEIDIKNPKTNHNSAGFTDQERQKMTELLSDGFIDSFRYLYPDVRDAYTWWSYVTKARDKNIGWRIDYFIVSARMKDRIKDCVIYSQVMGSDHCPVGLELKD
ncbi:MAG: exodeoxyribonuclease III [Saccharofermentanales bacterium]